MATTTLAAIMWLLLPALLLGLIVHRVFLETEAERARRLKRDYGFSQRRISQELGISTYKVRKYLASTAA